jgi:uncharacterized protein (TIGR02722 family)
MKPLIAIAVIFMAISCGPQRSVTRVDTDTVIDLSGRWNDTDSQQTADAMITQSLTNAWLSNFAQQNPGKKPVVIVGFVTNNTDEHIQSETFIRDLEKAFINSGQVRLVAGGAKRDEIRKERAQQQDYSSTETMKQWGQEIGADYMLQGDISSIIDSYNKEKVIFYQVNLQLTDIETTEIVWLGDKKIKKYIKG